MSYHCSTREEAALLAAQPIKAFLADEVLLLTVRIERAHEIEDRERERASVRATLCWDEDR